MSGYFAEAGVKVVDPGESPVTAPPGPAEMGEIATRWGIEFWTGPVESRRALTAVPLSGAQAVLGAPPSRPLRAANMSLASGATTAARTSSSPHAGLYRYLGGGSRKLAWAISFQTPSSLTKVDNLGIQPPATSLPSMR
jgi:hypothetical protein